MLVNVLVKLVSVSHSSLYFKPQSGVRCVYICVCGCIIIHILRRVNPELPQDVHQFSGLVALAAIQFSYKTLKALWLCELFPLQRGIHQTAAGRTRLGKCLVMWERSGSLLQVL